MESSIFTSLVPLAPVQSLAPITSIESIDSLDAMGQTSSATGFGQYLKDAINQLNALQTDADIKSSLLLTGQVEDFHTPIIALEKASLALGMATSLRNKLLESYQEIMRMQI